MGTSAPRAFERLEDRVFLTVTTDANGWTVVTPSADSRLVYVSSSTGNDSNNGLSPSTPVKTIAKGYTLLRDKYPDHLLLKRDDTFYERLIDSGTGDWRKGGRNADEPLLIGAYGTGARPKIRTGVNFALATYPKTDGTRTISHFFITSLDLFPDTFDHTNGHVETDGLRLYCPGENILVEDCLISGYQENIIIGGGGAGQSNVRIRRNVITDAHILSTIGNAHGLWIGGVNSGVVVEENIFDHNGWREGFETDRDTGKNHNVYAFNGTNVTIRNNVLSRGGYYNIKMVAGGTITGNFLTKSPEAIYLENPTLIENNVMTEPSSIPSLNRGIGINTYNASNATIRGNLITHVNNTNASGIAGIQLAHNTTISSAATVENNIVYDWRNGFIVNTLGNGTGSVIIRNNQLQMLHNSTAAGRHDSTGAIANFSYSNNVYASGNSTTANKWMGGSVSLATWKANTGETTAEYRTIAYPDPGRTIGGYATMLGLGTTFESLIAAARAMNKSNWSQANTANSINTWFRAGYGIVGTATPTSGTFLNATAPHAIEIVYNAPLSGAPAAGAMTVQNLDTNAVFTPVSAIYTAATQTARFTFGGALPEGTYRATYTGGFAFTFSHLPGDATGDRRVSTADFNVMAGNFGAGSGKTFQQGDFTYDGVVDSSDFALFATQYGKQLGAVAGGQFIPLTLPHAVEINYSSALAENPSASALSIQNLQTLATYSPASVSYNAATHTARFALASPLPEGIYRATYSNGFSFDFIFLPGDANLDGRVNTADFNILVANLGSSSGMTFAQGDFNYDGAVNSGDLTIYFQQYGKHLPVSGAAPLFSAATVESADDLDDLGANL